jgi:hypothetical protein
MPMPLGLNFYRMSFTLNHGCIHVEIQTNK